ncbi:endonuclease-reverse transcriptase [Elysia marginata]|uniref:Endonuclease-reverse transcriptase n=1 Tax=Elysia marginata TaxID=1093978 RepID=A0AAV4IY91_9GAST|nr:endonuclease-reverse transcriptase [Elysia marginata]
MYGCEAWSQKKDDNKRIEAAEMWFYRRILIVKWTDKRTNGSLLKELKIVACNAGVINQAVLSGLGYFVMPRDLTPRSCHSIALAENNCF